MFDWLLNIFKNPETATSGKKWSYSNGRYTIHGNLRISGDGVYIDDKLVPELNGKILSSSPVYVDGDFTTGNVKKSRSYVTYNGNLVSVFDLVMKELDLKPYQKIDVDTLFQIVEANAAIIFMNYDMETLIKPSNNKCV